MRISFNLVSSQELVNSEQTLRSLRARTNAGFRAHTPSPSAELLLKLTQSNRVGYRRRGERRMIEFQLRIVNLAGQRVPFIGVVCVEEGNIQRCEMLFSRCWRMRRREFMMLEILRLNTPARFLKYVEGASVISLTAIKDKEPRVHIAHLGKEHSLHVSVGTCCSRES